MKKSKCLSTGNFNINRLRDDFIATRSSCKDGLCLFMDNKNKGRHGTDPWPTPYCLEIFPTPQRLQNMPFIAYGDARSSAGLGHVCSCLFNEMRVSDVVNGWPHDHGPTNVGAMIKRTSKTSLQPFFSDYMSNC